MLGIISICVIILSLLFGEVTLRTRANHQLSGYTELYLGKSAKHFQSILLFFGMYSALLAYTIGLGEILGNFFNTSAAPWSIGAYLFLSYFVIKGLGIIKRVEFVVGLLLLGFVFTLAVLAQPHIAVTNWSGFSLAAFFVPYGAVLFACSGLVSIPEAKEILSAAKAERQLFSAILIGNLVPTLIYLCFAFIVIGVSGIETTQIATIGLSAAIGPAALTIGSLFSIVAMASSFLTLGTGLKESFQFDYRIKETVAILLTLIIPLSLYLFGIRNFFGIVSLSGALSVGVTGLFSLGVFWRARKLGKRKPEYIIPKWLAVPATIFIAAVFIAGLIYTL